MIDGAAVSIMYVWEETPPTLPAGSLAMNFKVVVAVMDIGEVYT
jgi:hypothetical protein